MSEKKNREQSFKEIVMDIKGQGFGDRGTLWISVESSIKKELEVDP